MFANWRGLGVTLVTGAFALANFVAAYHHIDKNMSINGRLFGKDYNHEHLKQEQDKIGNNSQDNTDNDTAETETPPPPPDEDPRVNKQPVSDVHNKSFNIAELLKNVAMKGNSIELDFDGLKFVHGTEDANASDIEVNIDPRTSTLYVNNLGTFFKLFSGTTDLSNQVQREKKITTRITEEKEKVPSCENKYSSGPDKKQQQEEAVVEPSKQTIKPGKINENVKQSDETPCHGCIPVFHFCRSNLMDRINHKDRSRDLVEQDKTKCSNFTDIPLKLDLNMDEFGKQSDTGMTLGELNMDEFGKKADTGMTLDEEIKKALKKKEEQEKKRLEKEKSWFQNFFGVKHQEKTEFEGHGTRVADMKRWWEFKSD